MSPTSPAFERTSKRRKGFPSETRVKRGHRFVHGDKELIEKLGRKDPCPCGSGQSFQAVLPYIGALSMGPSAMITGGKQKGAPISGRPFF
ncbi:MAG: SEC-C metal-binding domain-containing protein [Pseudomonadota bacterium]